MQSKSTGQSPFEVHAVGTQWWLDAHVSPLAHAASAVQPGTQTSRAHPHGTDVQMKVAPSAAQSTSPLHGGWGSQMQQAGEPPGGTH